FFFFWRTRTEYELGVVSVGWELGIRDSPLTLQRGNDGQPPWFEHDQMTVAEKILLRCTWLDPAEKEARRLHLQGMTVPDYTVKVRKWFCVMCDEDYEGEKCCPRCGTGVYSREGGLQEGNWKDRN
ncbi:zinc-ribbon domain-containing protein, partial [Escherichia coli]|uniref:zinc-ribbon domain-containing protein n=1 Tax=Escherichia coli TaxID=562 RepID=UPI0020241962